MRGYHAYSCEKNYHGSWPWWPRHPLFINPNVTINFKAVQNYLTRTSFEEFIYSNSDAETLISLSALGRWTKQLYCYSPYDWTYVFDATLQLHTTAINLIRQEDLEQLKNLGKSGLTDTQRWPLHCLVQSGNRIHYPNPNDLHKGGKMKLRCSGRLTTSEHGSK